ncbi:MAG: hypothetical protein A2020_05190 [Lentisphaerae bacterium GWF2_45_14]|nr:MAG: hypothetical protein A2020_05190 [Lentisphaerae bacterium GWF2_45_14]
MIAGKQSKLIKELLKRIEDNTYTKKLPSAKMLAEEFSVNSKTANKALNSLVEQGIASCVNGRGTFLKENSTSPQELHLEIICLGVADFYSNPYFSAIWHGITDEIQKSQYGILVKFLEEDRENGGQKNIYQDFSKAEGRIIIGTGNELQVKALVEDGTPFVIAGTKTDFADVSAVYAKTKKAAYDAVNLIISKGRRRIAFIGATSGRHRQIDVDKFHGYVEALLENNMKPDFALIKDTSAFPSAGYYAMQEILSRQTIDAIFVSHDHLCPGVYKAINESGLTIPGDIGVVGCNGVEVMLSPDLTTVSLPLKEIGKQSAQLLLRKIQQRDFHDNIQIALEGHLQIKDSI